MSAAFFLLIPLPLVCLAQDSVGSPSQPEERTPEKKVRVVRIHVTDVQGRPLHDVQIRLGVASRLGTPEIWRTDLQGEFRAELELEGNASQRVTVNVVASKDGYSKAREMATFAPGMSAVGIDLVMRESGSESDPAHIATMARALGPALREGAVARLKTGKDDWMRGCGELIERRNPSGAIPLLAQVVDQSPGCIECRTILSLALLEWGSWTAGSRELEEALKLNESGEAKRPEPFIVAGTFWRWKGDAAHSSRYYQKALKIEPKHPLALEEAGRLSVEQKDFARGEQLLGKALDAGAPPETRLLRIRALLELGELPEAASEMELYSTGREPKDLPFEGRNVYVQLRDRLEVAQYSTVKSVVDHSPQELQKSFPELKGLHPAATQAALPTILEKTGENVERFVKDFPNTISNEKVHLERLDKAGNSRSSLDQEFEYLLLPRKGEGGLGLEESRKTPAGHESALQGLNQGYVLTSGFSACSWVFDPVNQPSTNFRYLGRQAAGSKELLVVAYAQKPKTTKLKARLMTHRGSAPLLFQGIAWINPSNYQIVRLRNELLGPVPKLFLERQTTEIQYQKVEFLKGASAFWLPEKITVTTDFTDNLFRNIHSYSNFRLFNVGTKESVKSVLPATSGPAAPSAFVP